MKKVWQQFKSEIWIIQIWLILFLFIGVGALLGIATAIYFLITGK